MSEISLDLKPLTRAGFAAFGDVIESDARDSFLINHDMAERFHELASVDLRGEDARAIISLVNSRKYEMPRKVDHVEYHPLGSQAFVPLCDSPFIVVVAPAGEVPDGSRLAAFVTNGQQGVNYLCGTWHHVLLTPYSAMTFLCIDRAGKGNNCIDYFFDEDEQRLLAL